MNSYLPAFWAAAFIYLAIGIYAYRQDVKARLNCIFLAICLVAALWALSMAQILIEANPAIASLLYLLTSPGWGLGPGLVLVFAMELTRKRTAAPPWLVRLVCFLPSFAVVGRSLADFLLTTNFALAIQTGPSSFDFPSFWHLFYLVYYVIYLAGSVWMIAEWGYHASTRRQKLQARWISITLVIGLLLSFLNESLLPDLGITLLQQIPSLIMLVWVFGMWVAITRFRLMVLTPALATEEITSRMMDLLVLLNPDGRIVQVNRRAEELLGYRRGELLRQPLERILKERELIPTSLEEMRQSRGSHSVKRRLTLLDRDGAELPIQVSITGLLDRAGDYLGVVFVAQDLRPTLQLEHEVAERRLAEEALRRAAEELEHRVEERTGELSLANQALHQEISRREDLEADLRRHAIRLKELSRRLVETQETERRSLARELHDDFGQTLTAMKLALDQIEDHLSPPERPALTQSRELLQELLSRVRNLSLELRPSMLDDLGLLAAMTWQCKRFSEQTRILVDLRHLGMDRRFPAELETALYRIVQEALTNVARHTKTEAVQVAMEIHSGQIQLDIQDQGAGFDTAAIYSNPGHAGLMGIRERVDALGGTIEIESTPGKGTRLQIRVPLPHSKKPKREKSSITSSPRETAGTELAEPGPLPGG
jgi:PAS domain S-box-containing protein